jgi:mono/diheme cytochrome c family protein
MNRKGLTRIVAVLSFMLVRPALAQMPQPANTTIWDGVYSAEQAQRGEQLSQAKCGACHSSAEWASNAFVVRWSGGAVAHLRDYLRDNMPLDAPGSLTPAEYTAIVAYMLKLNRAPSGARELPSEDVALRRITVTRPATR